MITSYVHALIFSMFRIIGSCIISCIAFCFQHVSFTSFILYLFLLILLFLFYFFSVLKNSKSIKIEKSSKSLIACFMYITCDFGLVPSYLWHCAFTSLACFVCIYIFVGEILKSMGDCCKYIFKLVMNNWSIVLMVLILAQTCAYISSHLYFYVFAIKLSKCKSQNEKEILSYKSLSHILVFDQEKGKATFVLICIVLKKPNANS